jgi:hypothetical protein
MADRPITVGGVETDVTVKLPLSSIPVAGTFTVAIDSPDVPFQALTFTGININELEEQPDGSLLWAIQREWLVTVK